MLGSAFFIGWASTGLIVSTIADWIGRRKVVLFSYASFLTTAAFLLTNRDVDRGIVLMFLIGVSVSGIV
jgi:MFS family permease